MNNISVVIAIKDEKEHILESIGSVEGLAYEIIVADLGMPKETLEKLEKIKKLRIVKVKKEVAYIELVRDEVNAEAKGEYILLLDPDEVVTPGLATELKKTLGIYDFIEVPRKKYHLWKMDQTFALVA